MCGAGSVPCHLSHTVPAKSKSLLKGTYIISISSTCQNQGAQPIGHGGGALVYTPAASLRLVASKLVSCRASARLAVQLRLDRIKHTNYLAPSESASGRAGQWRRCLNLIDNKKN